MSVFETNPTKYSSNNLLIVWWSVVVKHCQQVHNIHNIACQVSLNRLQAWNLPVLWGSSPKTKHLCCFWWCSPVRCLGHLGHYMEQVYSWCISREIRSFSEQLQAMTWLNQTKQPQSCCQNMLCTSPTSSVPANNTRHPPVHGELGNLQGSWGHTTPFWGVGGWPGHVVTWLGGIC